MAKKEKEIVYYSDENEQDFSGMHIKKTTLKSDYKYYSTNPIYLFFAKAFTILLALPILWCIDIIMYRPKYINKKALKKVKGQGYYIYGNHTIALDPTMDAIFVQPMKRSVVIASHETFSISPLINPMIRAIGAIPVPNKDDEQMFKNYQNCMSHHIKKGHNIIIYPEAHVWRYYNDIRHFKSGAFRYPVSDNAPIFTFTKTFKKSKWRNIPKVIVYISGPIYPDTSLPYEQAVDKLKDDAYQSMKDVINTYGSYEHIKYIRKDK